MALRYRWLRFYFTVITVLFVGCSSEFENNQTSEYEEANHHISVGNYNAAIAIMDQRLGDEPTDKEARLILASAYAARAGIFMSEYIDVSRRVVEKIHEAEAFLESHSTNLFDHLEKEAKSSSQLDLLSTFENIYRVTYQVNQLISAFAIIPTLSENIKKDLERAVRLLDSEKTYSGGPVLYRGMLKLALLKNNLNSKYDMAYLGNCTIKLSRLIEQLNLLAHEVNGVMNDFFLGSLNKAKADQISQSADKMNREFDKALESAQHLGLTDEIDVSDIAQKAHRSCRK